MSEEDNSYEHRSPFSSLLIYHCFVANDNDEAHIRHRSPVVYSRQRTWVPVIDCHSCRSYELNGFTATVLTQQLLRSRTIMTRLRQMPAGRLNFVVNVCTSCTVLEAGKCSSNSCSIGAPCRTSRLCAISDNNALLSALLVLRVNVN